MAMDHPSTGMPGGGDMNGGKGGMHMTFFWSDRVQILFSSWSGDQGLGMYLLALFFVLAAAALLECLSWFSHRLSPPPSATGGHRASAGILLTIVHTFRMGLAYLVMLAVMSFNVGVLISALAGHALGFLFARSGIFARGGTRNQDGLPSTKYSLSHSISV